MNSHWRNFFDCAVSNKMEKSLRWLQLIFQLPFSNLYLTE